MRSGWKHGLVSALMVAVSTSWPVSPAFGAFGAPGCAEDLPSISDLNGDGNADSVIGDPDAEVDGMAAAGAITVVYGRPDDPRPKSAVRIVQSSDVVSGEAAAGNRFGSTIRVGFADADECADVFVGVPGQRVDGTRNAGAVVVLFGSEAGLGHGRPSRVWTEATPGVPGDPERGDRFGAEIALQTGVLWYEPQMIAIGAPTKAVAGIERAGVVLTAQLDDDGGLQPGSVLSIDQSLAGLEDEPERGDRFGEHLGLTDRGPSDLSLVVGVPRESVGSLRGAGVLDEITGLRPGETLSGQRWTQDDLDVGDQAEAGDRFGAAVSYSRDAITFGTHLAVGAPGEDVLRRDDGRVFYFDAYDEGENVVFDQSLDWFTQRPERGDHFGATLLMLPHQVTYSQAFLIIGVPGENLRGLDDAGLVHKVVLSSFTQSTLDQSSPGIPGRLGEGDRLGAVLGGFPATDGGEVAGGLMLGLPDDAEYPRGAALITRFRLVGGDPEDPRYRPLLWRPGKGPFAPVGQRFGASVAGTVGMQSPD